MNEQPYFYIDTFLPSVVPVGFFKSKKDAHKAFPRSQGLIVSGKNLGRLLESIKVAHDQLEPEYK